MHFSLPASLLALITIAAAAPAPIFGSNSKETTPDPPAIVVPPQSDCESRYHKVYKDDPKKYSDLTIKGGKWPDGTVGSRTFSGGKHEVWTGSILEAGLHNAAVPIQEDWTYVNVFWGAELCTTAKCASKYEWIYEATVPTDMKDRVSDYINKIVVPEGGAAVKC